MSKKLTRTFVISATLIFVSLMSMIEIPNAAGYGDETIQVNIDGASTYTEYEDATSFTITLADLDTSVTYALEWRLCDYEYDLDGDWVDGNCDDIELYQDYQDVNQDYLMAQATIGGDLSATGSTTISSSLIVKPSNKSW